MDSSTTARIEATLHGRCHQPDRIELPLSVVLLGPGVEVCRVTDEARDDAFHGDAAGSTLTEGAV